MNKEKVNQIVGDYEGLMRFIRAKVKVLESISNTYDTNMGIESIEICGDNVEVV